MKTRNKILALVLSLALVITCLPLMVYAEGEGESIVGPPLAFNVPKSAESSVGFIGTIGTDTIENLYADGVYFDIKYGDGTVKTYVYGTYSFKDSKGKTQKVSGFLQEGGDPSNENAYIYVYMDDQKKVVFKEGHNTGIKLNINAPYEIYEGDTLAGYDYTRLSMTVNVWCTRDKPVAVRFVPAKGFKAKGVIGYNYIDESYFYGKGNSFEVAVESKFDSGSGIETSTYQASYDYTRTKKDGDVIEGFYDNGNVNFERFEFEAVEVYLKKGKNKVTIPYYVYYLGESKPKKLELTVNVYAEQYDVYANWPVLDYTGKAIGKKAFAKQLVIRNSNDKVIPASEYTYKWKKHKKIGWYTVKVRFKKKGKYKTDAITVDYAIGPKTPKIQSIAGGKKKLTVNWKKYTKAQLKNIDGLVIEIARDKNFTTGNKIVRINKKALKKSGKKVIRKLKGGKKYYVKMYTFKNVKQNGGKFMIYSNDSKIRNARTKK